MNPKIIYEDENIIVIDKPAGLTVHATNENDTRETLVSFLVEHCPAIESIGDPSTGSPQASSGQEILRPGIVHRLDKETSGLMIVAKNNETFTELKKQFKEREITKKYTALVAGLLAQDEGVVKIPLQKIGSKTRTAPRGTQNDKNPVLEASTNYRVIKRFPAEEYSLLEITPKTGRMHQIRVHMASINHPIACDKLYGGKAKKCPAGLLRHFLHASYLKLKLNNALMEFDSELPKDLKNTLESL